MASLRLGGAGLVTRQDAALQSLAQRPAHDRSVGMERSPAGMKLPFDAPKLGCWRVPSAS